MPFRWTLTSPEWAYKLSADFLVKTWCNHRAPPHSCVLRKPNLLCFCSWLSAHTSWSDGLHGSSGHGHYPYPCFPRKQPILLSSTEVRHFSIIMTCIWVSVPPLFTCPWNSSRWHLCYCPMFLSPCLRNNTCCPGCRHILGSLAYSHRGTCERSHSARALDSTVSMICSIL